MLLCTEIGEDRLLPCEAPVRNFSVARRRFCEGAKGDEGGRRGGLYRPGRVTEGAGE
jgi:hypothetical protein